MPNLLANAFSYGDFLKRKVGGLLSDPMATLEQMAGQLSDDQRTNGENMANAYPMAGDKSVLVTPAGKAKAQGLLADYGAQSGIAGMFVGKGSKTWDAISAQKAEQMTAQGVDPRKVWSETGTWKGPDGAWRQEIPDNAAAVQGGLGRVSHDQMKAINGGEWINENNFLRQHYKTPEANAIRQRATMTSGRVTEDNPMISDVINHPNLLGAYGDLGSIPVAIDNKMPIGNAALGKMPTGQDLIIMSPTNDKESISNAIHELQHSIQGRERWAQGGAPSDFGQQKDAELARDALAWKRELEESRKTMRGADTIALENAAVKRYQEIDAIDWLPSRQARDLARQPDVLYSDKYPGGQGDSLRELVELYGLDKKVTPTKDIDLYHRLAGEAEARATQARIPLNASQRRALFPEDSYDVPVNQLIVRGLLGK